MKPISGVAAERMASIILEGNAFRVGKIKDFDVWWGSQMRRIEVKGINIDSVDIGKKTIKADVRNNWGKNDYYMLMIYIDRHFDHCYLIPSADVTNHPRKVKSITIPPKWDNFIHRGRLYAMNTDSGLRRLQ